MFKLFKKLQKKRFSRQFMSMFKEYYTLDHDGKL